MTRRFLRGSLLAFGLVLGLAGLSYANTDDPTHDCVRGPTGGRWELPDAQSFGHARGILLNRAGMPVFGLNAAVLQAPLTDRHGRIEGVIHTLPGDGSDPQPVAAVRGVYRTPDGVHGRFSAVFVRPTMFGPLLLGGMHGRFADPDQEEDDGGYRGRWRICRPDESGE